MDEVRVLGPDEHPPGEMTCGACGRSWDDSVVTSVTPVPSGRCPFEYDHDDEEYVSRCPACGEYIDYCQGHGLIGDPQGHAILARHDEDDHSLCHPDSDCSEG